MELKRQLGLVTGIFVIIADMIGTGIFMTTGAILGMTKSAPLVLALWGIGGLTAVCGALCYAELASLWPEAGGEYVYLRNIYGRLPAFLTGWISLVVGFSAPIAASSLLLVQYLDRFFNGISGVDSSVLLLDSPWIQKSVAAALVVFFGAMHVIGVKRGSSLQNVLTGMKILLVLALIVFGFYQADWSMTHRLAARYDPAPAAVQLVSQAGPALLVVMYAYSGWNCAAYLGGEIVEPGKNLPRALLSGTLITSVLYVLLNVLFLLSAEGTELMGKEEIGAIAVSHLFGTGISGVFTLGIAFVLLSSVSAQMMAGPRVVYAMARDGMIFRQLAGLHQRFETPHNAIVVQTLLAVFYIFTGSALTLVIYIGFALSIFPLLTVIGLLRLRRAGQGAVNSYRAPFYPFLPILFITLTIIMMLTALITWTKTSCFAIAVVLLGIPAFRIWERLSNKSRKTK